MKTEEIEELKVTDVGKRLAGLTVDCICSIRVKWGS